MTDTLFDEAATLLHIIAKTMDHDQSFKGIRTAATLRLLEIDGEAAEVLAKERKAVR